MRYGGKQTLYDVLDLPRGVSSLEVENAYRRIRAQMEKDKQTPDARRLALLREALEVLGDDRRRAAYDASLMADPVAPPREKVSARTIAIVAGLIGLATAAYFVMRPRPSATAFRDALTEVANISVARLQSIDMAGRRKSLGFATAVGEGTMATTCHGITPGMQLVVNNGAQAFGATVTIADYAADVCRLMAAGGTTKPLDPAAAPPRAGDRVYVVTGADGALALQEAKVLGPVTLRNGAAIEIDRAIAPGEDGAAVFDAQGKLAGITTSAGSTADGRGVVLPSAWINAARVRPAPVR